MSKLKTPEGLMVKTICAEKAQESLQKGIKLIGPWGVIFSIVNKFGILICKCEKATEILVDARTIEIFVQEVHREPTWSEYCDV